jgi:hypothetical protein
MRAATFACSLLVLLGCEAPFAPDPGSKLEGVRILAVRADAPYAKPNDTVNLEVLAVDARQNPTVPVALSWIPMPCIDPEADAYYNCYSSFATMFPRGTDLAPFLTSGAQFSFSVPGDVLARSASAESGTPYGTVIVFTMACAGHVEYVGPRGTSPEAIPFGCFDASGGELGPDDFVFAFARVFAFSDRTNHNPAIDALTFGGRPVDPVAGITLDHCPNPSGNGQTSSDCGTTPIDVVVPADSQEIDPSNLDDNGAVGRENIWVDYYLTGGRVKDDARIVYDAKLGRVPSADDLEAPGAPGDQTLWAVVHDDRGGVNWIQVPVHAR